MKSRLLFSAASALAVGAGIFVLWWGKRGPQLLPRPVATPTPRIEEQMREALRVPTPVETPVQPAPAVETSFAPRLDLSREKLPWEEKIESVLADKDLTAAGQARQLFAMLPGLPEKALTTAAEEAVARLPDADYQAVALPIVANPQTHGLVQAVLFANLMERPDAITLPVLLRIAQIAQHPYAPSARENLDLLLGTDFGTDWPKWDAAIRQALAP